MLGGEGVREGAGEGFDREWVWGWRGVGLIWGLWGCKRMGWLFMWVYRVGVWGEV